MGFIWLKKSEDHFHKNKQYAMGFPSLSAVMAEENVFYASQTVVRIQWNLS